MTSILTNVAAMAALQTLRGISNNLQDTQNRVSSGYRVEKAADNAAYWSIATTMRSDNIRFRSVRLARLRYRPPRRRQHGRRVLQTLGSADPAAARDPVALDRQLLFAEHPVALPLTAAQQHREKRRGRVTPGLECFNIRLMETPLSIRFFYEISFSNLVFLNHLAVF